MSTCESLYGTAWSTPAQPENDWVFGGLVALLDADGFWRWYGDGMIGGYLFAEDSEGMMTIAVPRGSSSGMLAGFDGNGLLTFIES